MYKGPEARQSLTVSRKSWCLVPLKFGTQKRYITRRREKVNRIKIAKSKGYTKSLVYHAKKYAFSLKSHVYSSIKVILGSEMSKICIFNDHSPYRMNSRLDSQ